MSLLDDLLSRDPQRIWSASGAIRIFRDRPELTGLAQHLDQIATATTGIPLGGALRANATHLAFALKKLEFIRLNPAACLCALYPQNDLYNPAAEEKSGNVVIDATNFLTDDPTWIDFYACHCTTCQTRFRVEEREYHYTWWAWQKI